jgi:hypothetical protein
MVHSTKLITIDGFLTTGAFIAPLGVAARGLSAPIFRRLMR